MPFIKEIITSIVSSSIVLGLFVFIFRKLLISLISVEFEKREKINEYKIKKAFKYDDQYTEKEIGVYPEILENIYRIKNIILDGIKEDLAFKWSGDFRPLVGLLTESLYKYRLFIPDEIFEKLHRFKRLAQDLLIKYDILTRDEYEFDKDFYQNNLPSLRLTYNQMEALFEEIENGLRKRIKNMGTVEKCIKKL